MNQRSEPPTMTDADRYLGHQVREFTMRGLVAVVAGEPGTWRLGNGSGAMFRIGSRHVLLTAAHVIRRDLEDEADCGRRHIVRRGLEDPLFDFEERRFDHPKSTLRGPGAGTDVAAVLIRREYDPVLSRSPALDVTVIADSCPPVTESEFIVATGYPASGHRVDADGSRVQLTTFSLIPAIRTGCRGLGHPARGLHMAWSAGATDVITGKQATNPDASGMSGAPIWRMPRWSRTGIWTPHWENARIVGIQVGFKSELQCARASKVEEWRPWFFDVVVNEVRKG